LTTDYKSPFPLVYKSFSFSGSAGWLLLNGRSPLATSIEKRGVISPPYALLSQSYGMVRFGATNFTFDLIEFHLLGWTQRIGEPQKLTITIRTDKMGQDAFPYALPITNGKEELVRARSAMGGLVEGIKWVELAVWQTWLWSQPGVQGTPAQGWTIDNLIVRKRRACGERGSEWEELRRRGVVW
jgi:hypothetical protein